MPVQRSANSLLLGLLLLFAAVIGGLVARLVPLGWSSSTPLSSSSAPVGSLAPLVQKTAPSVVNVAVMQPSPAEQNPLLQDPFFRRYFGVPDTVVQPAIAAGSGVIVDAGRGLVVTNFHVVRNARAVEVVLNNGRRFPADPVALAPSVDLAVLKIDAKGLPSLSLGDSSKLQVGDYVLAIGNAFGLGQTVTGGIISATDRALGNDDSRRFIQTDAPINPGNSGGPLIDSQGKIIGINSALFSPGGGNGNVGIGFAIPSNVVRSVVAQAESSG